MECYVRKRFSVHVYLRPFQSADKSAVRDAVDFTPCRNPRYPEASEYAFSIPPVSVRIGQPFFRKFFCSSV